MGEVARRAGGGARPVRLSSFRVAFVRCVNYSTLVMDDSYPPPPGYTHAPELVLPSLLNLALVIRRRTPFSTPNREGVVGHLVCVFKGVALVVEPARPYVVSWLGASKASFVSDDLETLDLVPGMHKINVLHEEEPTVHPLKDDLPFDIWT